MIKAMHKIYAIIEPQYRKRLMILLVGSLFSGLAEILALFSIIPFVLFAANPDLSQSKSLQTFADVFSLQSANEIYIGLIGLALLLLVASNGYLAWIASKQIRFAHMQGHRISAKLFEHYLSRPYTFFLDKNTNELSKNVLSEVGRVILGVLLPGLQMATKICSVLCLFLVLLIKEPFMSLMIACTLGGLYGLTYSLVHKRLNHFGVLHSHSNEQRYRIVGELLSGIKALKVTSHLPNLVRQYDKPSYKVAYSDIQSQSIPQYVRYGLEVLVYGGMLSIALVLMTRYGSLNASLPTLALFAFAGYRMMPAMQQVFNAVTTIRFHLKAIDLVHRQLTQSHLEHKAMQSVSLATVQQIELRDIEFTYPQANKDVLKAINISLNRGQTVGLVGATGSGKTTIVDLILGLLNPDKGGIVLDNKPYNPEQQSYKTSVGYVPQDIFMLDDSLLANIAFGEKEQDMDIDRAVWACKIAQIHDTIIELDDGYRTHVGQQGVQLSGGQRQRIGIARALYSKPTLLVLDEATSALDSVTEHKFLKALNEDGLVPFVVMIAHRLASIQHCDKLYYLENGRCCAHGTFDELVLTSKGFNQLTQQQAIA